MMQKITKRIIQKSRTRILLTERSNECIFIALMRIHRKALTVMNLLYNHAAYRLIKIIGTSLQCQTLSGGMISEVNQKFSYVNLCLSLGSLIKNIYVFFFASILHCWPLVLI